MPSLKEAPVEGKITRWSVASLVAPASRRDMMKMLHDFSACSTEDFFVTILNSLLVTKFNSFTVVGEQWIRLKGNFGENQDIKVEATMFDGSIPVSKAGGPDSIEITNIFVQGNDKRPSWPYFCPQFKELDDGANFVEFLHEYMLNKDKTEFIRWMETVKIKLG
ncbi:hypothetical protein Q3G72_032006 [Acer saccharum]|nr:hypothetical protein Q3G72_032006 [Acer saccharum]